MQKETDKQYEQYPVEFPSRSGEIKRSPIVDVVESEIYPLKFANCHKSNPRFNENITEVVTTEISPDKAEQTTHEQQTQANK